MCVCVCVCVCMLVPVHLCRRVMKGRGAYSRMCIGLSFDPGLFPGQGEEVLMFESV